MNTGTRKRNSQPRTPGITPAVRMPAAVVAATPVLEAGCYQRLVTAAIQLLVGQESEAVKLLQQLRLTGMKDGNEHLLYLCASLEAAKAQCATDSRAFTASMARAQALAATACVMNGDPLPHRVLDTEVSAPAAAPRVRITTLGRFGIAIDGIAIDLSSIRQRRPLELLKAIIALGGRDVTRERIYEALWPEAEGDAAHRNFTIALHRLRKILPVNFIVLRGRNLSIDSDLCHVDLWDHERQLRSLEAALLNSGKMDGDTLSRFGAGCGRAFMDGEEAAWAYSVRERLRERCLRLMTNLARHAHRAGLHTEVIQLCRLGLRIDPLAEELYRIEIRSHQALGESSAVLATFRLCSETLQRELGVAPARETVSLLPEARVG